MTEFSANLGFLWAELSLPDAIRAAKRAGFDAVECHWPYDTAPELVSQALAETGLSMLGLNTRRGDVEAGENGLAAIPGREDQARQFIDEAIDYAVKINTPNIHVMAGFASGEAARAVYIENLKYACEAARPHNITIMIEPLNHYDAQGYFLSTTSEAKSVIEDVGHSNLKLMFDCYHVQLMEGDVSHRLEALLPLIAHIQFASVPERAAPDQGELNYRHIFDVIKGLGYSKPLGAEYKPDGPTEPTLSWMKDHR